MKPTTKWIIAGLGLTAWLIGGSAYYLLSPSDRAVSMTADPDATPTPVEPILPEVAPPPPTEAEPELVTASGVVPVDDFEVPYVEAQLKIDTTNVSTSDEQTVLFLHGAKFDANTWSESGVLEKVANSKPNLRAVAVTLPKVGEPPKFTTPDNIDPGSFLKATIEALDIDPAQLTIVSPSFSGKYSLEMLEQYPSMELGGFVGIAPKDVEHLNALPGWQMDNINTLIMWAENDDRIPTNDDTKGAQALRDKMPSSVVELYPTNEHAFYFVDPDMKARFTDDLISFLQTAPTASVDEFQDAA